MATMAEFVVEFGKSGTPPAPDGRLDAPAFHRNHEAIWSAIGGFLSEQTGDVLELGSGTGQHITAYAGRSPRLTCWPSDIYPSHLASIEGLAAARRPCQFARAAAYRPRRSAVGLGMLGGKPAARSRPCCA